jgi:hypothetical protein
MEIQKQKNAPLVAPERDEEPPAEPGMEGEKKAPLVALGFDEWTILAASEEQRRRPAVVMDGHGWRIVEAFPWLSHSPCWMVVFGVKG